MIPYDDDEPPRFVEPVPTEPPGTNDDDGWQDTEGIDGIDPAVLVRGFDGDAFALATIDDRTGVWYLMRNCGLGNMMRTRHVTTVARWRAPGLIRDYLDRLPDASKADLMRRPLFIVPVALKIVFAGAFERITIATRPVAHPEPGGPTIEYELGTAPLPKRRRRKKPRDRRHEP